MENKRIAEVLYNLCCDMDYMDYADNMESELDIITEELNKLSSSGEFDALSNIITRVAIQQDEYTRDFVNEIRGCLNDL